MTSVNQILAPSARGLHTGLCLVVIAAGGLLAGCSTTTQKVVPTTASQDRSMLAITYDVEPNFVAQGEVVTLEGIRFDLASASEMGFGKVVLRHVDDADRVALLDAVAESGLGAVVPDSSSQHYIRTGLMPDGCGTCEDLVRRVSADVRNHAAFSGLAVEVGEQAVCGERYASLAAACAESGISLMAYPTLVRNADSSFSSHGDRLTILANFDDLPEDQSATEQWLFDFHQNLAGGGAYELLVDRYRGISGEYGLVEAGEQPAVAVLAALDQVCDRFQSWAPKLAGLRRIALSGVSGLPDSARAVVFAGDRRRFVLLFNCSRSEYLRSKVELPEEIAGLPAKRAVEVPASADRFLGRVLKAGRSGIVVDVELRPGDATLFELF